MTHLQPHATMPTERQRTKELRSVRQIIFLALALSGMAAAQTVPPALYFSDLVSGPNSGGQNNEGVWVTIWGKGFGATQGSSTVTVGGGAAANYPLWTDTRITFQLGSAAASGNIVV